MRRWLVVLGMVLALLAGCAREEPTAEAAAGAALRFMEALAGGDAGQVWGALTAEARRRMDSGAVASYLADHTVRFEAVGAAREIEPGVMRWRCAGRRRRMPAPPWQWA